MVHQARSGHPGSGPVCPPEPMRSDPLPVIPKMTDARSLIETGMLTATTIPQRHKDRDHVATRQYRLRQLQQGGCLPRTGSRDNYDLIERPIARSKGSNIEGPRNLSITYSSVQAY